jgi:organic radical activating enzyme
MKYKIAERFKSLQGEGVYTGTPMAFIRFVGCSVGKRICQHCDTDFDKVGPGWRGGGELGELELATWTEPYRHVCLTGGEPLDQELDPLFRAFNKLAHPPMIHIETSGTKMLGEATLSPDFVRAYSGAVWLCVSPKPGFLEEMIFKAHEVKVIVPGLGEINRSDSTHWRVLPEGYKTANESQNGELKKWPDLSDAIRWANEGKKVFIQPRNGKFEIEKQNLMYCLDVLKEHPELNLSTQMHKILKVQ